MKKKPIIRKTLIRNYGLFWDRNKVDWAKGILKGYKKQKKSEECNFQDQIGIYVLYNEDKEILYVGQAGNGNSTLFSRLKAHNNRDHLVGWWEFFSWFGLIPITKNGRINAKEHNAFIADKSKTLDSLEGVLIAAINPKMNKQGEKLGDKYIQIDAFSHIDFNGISKQISGLQKQIQELKKKLIKK